jgi:hypothetical protein
MSSRHSRQSDPACQRLAVNPWMTHPENCFCKVRRTGDNFQIANSVTTSQTKSKWALRKFAVLRAVQAHDPRNGEIC